MRAVPEERHETKKAEAIGHLHDQCTYSQWLLDCMMPPSAEMHLILAALTHLQRNSTVGYKM